MHEFLDKPKNNPKPLSGDERKDMDSKFRVLEATVEAVAKFQERDGPNKAV